MTPYRLVTALLLGTAMTLFAALVAGAVWLAAHAIAALNRWGW